jgi:hypothetical protein
MKPKRRSRLPSALGRFSFCGNPLSGTLKHPVQRGNGNAKPTADPDGWDIAALCGDIAAVLR